MHTSRGFLASLLLCILSDQLTSSLDVLTLYRIEGALQLRGCPATCVQVSSRTIHNDIPAVTVSTYTSARPAVSGYSNDLPTAITQSTLKAPVNSVAASSRGTAQVGLSPPSGAIAAGENGNQQGNLDTSPNTVIVLSSTPIPGVGVIQVLVQLSIQVSTKTVTVAVGSVTQITVTSTQTSTITTTVTSQNLGGRTIKAGQSVVSSTLATTGAYQNSTLLSPTSSIVILSDTRTSSTLSSTAISTISSSPGSIPSSSSTFTSATSVSDILAVLRAASATEFCSTFLGYVQPAIATTTETDTKFVASSSTAITTTFTTSSVVVSRTGSSTLYQTLTSVVVFVSTLQFTSATTTTTTNVQTSSTTSLTLIPLLEKRQSQVIATPSAISGRPSAAISSACSQLVSSPVPSSSTITETVTTSSTSRTIVTATQKVLQTATSSTISTISTTTSTTTLTTTSTSTTSTTTETSTTSTTTTVLRVVQTQAVRLGSPFTSNANSDFCGPGGDVDFFQASTAPPSGIRYSYVVPSDGQILSASSFDYQAGVLYFQVYRPIPGAYQIVYLSPATTFTGSQTTVNYAITPFVVQRGDVIGLHGSGGPCVHKMETNQDSFRNGQNLQPMVDKVVTVPNGPYTNARLNVAAVFLADV